MTNLPNHLLDFTGDHVQYPSWYHFRIRVKRLLRIGNERLPDCRHLHLKWDVTDSHEAVLIRYSNKGSSCCNLVSFWEQDEYMFTNFDKKLSQLPVGLHVFYVTINMSFLVITS